MTDATTTGAYHAHGPTLVNVSGGRTSGYMLAKVLEAHGGTLPDDVVPVFCNTGLEHEATYQFLREMRDRWGYPRVWLEYRRTEGKHSFAAVDYCTASRNGEPFTQVIDARSYLPNPVTRFCTAELKIRTGERFAKSLGWDEWDRMVGLRADEPRRVAKMKAAPDWEWVRLPLAEAGATVDDVRAFWRAQPFDLQLPGDDPAYGNCVGCFLKGKHKLAKVFRTDPGAAAWWIEQERRIGSVFRIDRPTYEQQIVALTVQGQMFDDSIEDDTLPCSCHD